MWTKINILNQNPTKFDAEFVEPLLILILSIVIIVEIELLQDLGEKF